MCRKSIAHWYLIFCSVKGVQEKIDNFNLMTLTISKRNLFGINQCFDRLFCKLKFPFFLELDCYLQMNFFHSNKNDVKPNDLLTFKQLMFGKKWDHTEF